MTNATMHGTNDGTNQTYSNQMNPMTNFIMYGTNTGTKRQSSTNNMNTMTNVVIHGTNIGINNGKIMATGPPISPSLSDGTIN